MPDRLEVVNVTCAAGVAAGAPTEVVLPGVVACQVVRVTIRIPAGHAGLTGIALGYGHQAIFPRTQPGYISGDDEVLVYDLTDYDPGPQWQAFLMNGDVNSHTWQVRFEVNELGAGTGMAAAAPAPVAAIYTAAGERVGVA